MSILQDAWRGFNQTKRRFGVAPNSDPAAMFATADVVARISDQTKKNDAVQPATKIESFELTDLSEHKIQNTAEEHSFPSTHVQPKLTEETSLGLQDTSAKRRKIANDTTVEDLSSAEESSALIIANKHTTKHKNDTVTVPPLKDNSHLKNLPEVQTIPVPILNDIDVTDSTEKQGQTVKKSPRVHRLLPTVTGKELKINPRTGQFREKQSASRQDENSNDTTPIDQQSMVIVNQNSIG